MGRGWWTLNSQFVRSCQCRHTRHRHRLRLSFRFRSQPVSNLVINYQWLQVVIISKTQGYCYVFTVSKNSSELWRTFQYFSPCSVGTVFKPVLSINLWRCYTQISQNCRNSLRMYHHAFFSLLWANHWKPSTLVKSSLISQKKLKASSQLNLQKIKNVSQLFFITLNWTKLWHNCLKN